MESVELEGLPPAAAVERAADSIEGIRPDLLLVLGDRFEILGACLAATHAQVPIAHIHGGEASYGSFDDQIRHAITKLAHLHFAAAEPYADALRRMGERRVWVTGAPGIDNLYPMPPRTREKRFVVTYHPETNGHSDPRAVVEALRRFPEYEVVWTGVNNDPGADDIEAAFRPFGKWVLGSRDYVRLCRASAAVVGNSSAGLVECPTMEVPTVNIGRRQDGRLKGPSVIDCNDDIEAAIRRAIAYDGPYDNPYGGPGASARIARIVETHPLVREKAWSM